MPAFPSAAASAPPKPAQQPKQVDLSQLPDSTEDYAKALQEAYRRGAEAAQAMAAAAASSQQPPPTSPTDNTGQINPSTSCPDFQQEAAVSSNPPIDNCNPNTKDTKPPPSQVSVGNASNLQASVPNPLSMPAPSVVHPIRNPITHIKHSVPMMPVATSTPLVPTTHQPEILAKPGLAIPQVVPPQAQRSMSLPDMSSYAAQQEEEKRQKRLARNRASARLRRLRKKNLVEAYEQEVGILEKTLGQLKAHEWGENDNVAALTEALSMDRGQQVLSFKERHEAACCLLDQQLQWIEMLEEIMMEDYVLQNVRNGEFAELRDILGLDDEQLDQIEGSKVGWEEEWAALQTLKSSITAMRENDWLWNESVSSITEQFMGILHKNQISKFLLWADHNAEAIDELDGVNAYSGMPNGPVFAFGVENQPVETYCDEEK